MSATPYTLHLGDCLESLRQMPDNSVDAVVTDPPYGLSFMGKKWDYDVPSVEVWAECLRVLKPGGHLLAFFGTRTYHRGVTRIEDAGFEIRDQIGWVFGSGFPKSHNGPWGGTALKPAWEPICMARKALISTVEANWLNHGTGGLNIDGCRVETADDLNGGAYSAERKPSESEWVKNGGTIHSSTGKDYMQPSGRWPANLIHDGSEEVLAGFPESKGQQGRARTDGEAQGNNIYGSLNHVTKQPEPRGDTGSAARFFYCAKANRKDRNEGLIDPGPQFKHGTTLRKVENTATKGNHHPCIKPTNLMAYLVRLVTPPGGVVLDPFMGSGSTGKACMREGFRFIGCELSPEYMEIARARIEFERARANTAKSSS